MSEKVFFLGMIAGVYYLFSHYLKTRGRFSGDTVLTCCWHAVFSAIVVFVPAVLLAVGMDNRRGAVLSEQLFTNGQMAFGILAALGGVLYALLRGCAVKAEIKNGLNQVIKKDMEWSSAIFSTMLAASIIMGVLIQSYVIQADSMEKTLLGGDQVLLNKIVFGLPIPFTDKKVFKLRPVRRNDLLAFRFPSQDPDEFQCGGKQYGKDIVKRVIGMPGDTVEIRKGKLYVNGELDAFDTFGNYIDGERYPKSNRKFEPGEYQYLWENRRLGNLLREKAMDNFGPVTVPPANYLVLGDNRDRSCDSRQWGPVPEKYVQGSVVFIYLPLSRLGVVSQ